MDADSDVSPADEDTPNPFLAIFGGVFCFWGGILLTGVFFLMLSSVRAYRKRKEEEARNPKRVDDAEVETAAALGQAETTEAVPVPVPAPSEPIAQVHFSQAQEKGCEADSPPEDLEQADSKV